jgi:ketosteroid isomerase-like protein
MRCNPILVLALAGCLAAPALLAADKEQDAVLAAEKGWSTGVSTPDYALLDKFLADDLTYTHSSGASDTKASYIDKLKTGKARYFRADYEAEPRVQILSHDTALTFGRVKVVTLGPNNTQTPATLAFLHVFVKRHGQWQLVAHQSAKVN